MYVHYLDGITELKKGDTLLNSVFYASFKHVQWRDFKASLGNIIS